MFQSLRARYQRWSDLRQIEAELNASSDRELADIGINRADIAELLRQKPALGVTTETADPSTGMDRRTAA
jgi:uncharacterized protein YjiS (DUF1127 family)